MEVLPPVPPVLEGAPPAAEVQRGDDETEVMDELSSQAVEPAVTEPSPPTESDGLV